MKLVYFLLLVSLALGQKSQTPVCTTTTGGSSGLQVPVCQDLPHIRVPSCPGVTFHLPRDNQVTDYVRYRAYFPALKEGTVCMWLQTSHFWGNAAAMSYATTGHHNEWAVEMLTAQSIRVNLQGIGHDAKFSTLSADKQFHVCTGFSSKLSRRAFYLNGRCVLTRSVRVNGVRGGGTLLLGQEQDKINAGALNKYQAFSGNITNFMVWPRFLSAQEISNIARNCDCPSDYTVAMTLDRAELNGEAEYSVNHKCPTL